MRVGVFLAPGRVRVAVGAGFTGALHARARASDAGAQGAGAVPLDVSCRGERAQALARRLGDGAMTGIVLPGALGRLREAIGPELPLVVHAVGGSSTTASRSTRRACGPPPGPSWRSPSTPSPSSPGASTASTPTCAPGRRATSPPSPRPIRPSAVTRRCTAATSWS